MKKTILRALVLGLYNQKPDSLPSGDNKFHTKGNRGVTVPYHGKDLKRKTAKHIIKQSGLELSEFLKLL